MSLIKKNTKLNLGKSYLLVQLPLFNKYRANIAQSYSTRAIRIWNNINNNNTYLYLYLVTISEAHKVIELLNKDNYNSTKAIFFKLPVELDDNSSDKEITEFINKYDKSHEKEWELKNLIKIDL